MHFLYVAVGESGLIKVGVTRNPKQRAYETRGLFKKRGDKLRQIKYCPGLYLAFGVEASLCRELSGMATQVHGREWFTGLDFDEVYAIAHDSLMDARSFQLARPDWYAALDSDAAQVSQPAQASERS